MQLNTRTLVSCESLTSECYSTRTLLASRLRKSTRARVHNISSTTHHIRSVVSLWQLPLGYGFRSSSLEWFQVGLFMKTIAMAIDPGETFAHFLQNYQSYSSTARCIANRGPSDHEAMETLATAAWKGTSDSKSINYALNLRARHSNSRACVYSAITCEQRASRTTRTHHPGVSRERALSYMRFVLYRDDFLQQAHFGASTLYKLSWVERCLLLGESKRTITLIRSMTFQCQIFVELVTTGFIVILCRKLYKC